MECWLGAMSSSDRRAKFQQLQRRWQDTSKANRRDVLGEQAKQRETSQRASRAHAFRLAKAERTLEERDLLERGEDVARHRAKTYTIEENEAWERKLEEKERSRDKGMMDFQDLAERSYQRQLKRLTPDVARYQRDKAASADEAQRDPAAYGTHAPDDDAVDRLVQHLNYEHDQIQRRSRRRDDDLDVEGTYINQRNKRFNRKIQRVRTHPLTTVLWRAHQRVSRKLYVCSQLTRQWNEAPRTYRSPLTWPVCSVQGCVESSCR